jgi:hypothetical protein
VPVREFQCAVHLKTEPARREAHIGPRDEASFQEARDIFAVQIPRGTRALLSIPVLINKILGIGSRLVDRTSGNGGPANPVADPYELQSPGPGHARNPRSRSHAGWRRRAPPTA